MPRSRTKWLSTFLAYGGWQCGHEELIRCRSIEDITSWLAQPLTGTVETAGAAFWRLLPDRVRVVTLRRPIPEILASLRRGGLVFNDAPMTAMLTDVARKLDQIEARRPDVLSLTFEDLATETGCARVFEHCLGLPRDHAWWAACDPINIQVSIPHFVRYITAHAPQIEKLRRTARHEVLRRFRRPIELNGVTFQQESFARMFRDGDMLMSDECALLGDYPEAWKHINVPLFERLEEGGGLHIYTARSNGKMFGYLVSAIGEAFFARDQLEAEQVAFYADPNWPGLGRKLQHASIEDLRGKGITRVMMFQADETRRGSVYRRLGARQTGQRFVKEL
jgi:hypothetical protein